MSINLYQREMYRSYLEHGERRNHKYLYKIGDRYIYPEDVKNGAKNVGKKVANSAKEFYNDRKIYGNAAKSMASDAGKRAKSLSEEVWEDRGIYADAAKNMVKDAGKKIKSKIKSISPEDVADAINPVGRGMKAGKGLVKSAKNAADNAKKKKQKEIEDEYQLPDGWKKGMDGYVYDDIGAIVPNKEVEKYRKKKTVAKK